MDFSYKPTCHKYYLKFGFFNICIHEVVLGVFPSERQHRCYFSFSSNPDHNVGVICKNLHQDIHCKLLQKNLLKKLDFLAQLELYYSKYSILTHGQTPLTGGKDKSCWSNPVKVVKTSSTFLLSCWLSAPSVTVVLCLLKTQYGKFRQQTFVYTEVLWSFVECSRLVL